MGIRWKKAAWPFLAVIAISLSLGFAGLGPARQAIAETETPGKGGEDGSYSSRHHGRCCTVAGGKCACGTGAVALNRLPRSELEVKLLAFVPPDKEPTQPEEKKATPEAKTLGDEISKALLNHQRALKDAYVCCTMPGCVFCQTAGDSCPCGNNLRKGEPVCPECWGGWQAGQGAIPAVRREDVKIFPKATLKALYEKRAKRFDQVLESRPPEKK
jgi:hypothetical protein